MTGTRHLLVFAVVALLANSGPCAAQQQSRFDQRDANGDGRLTRDELPERIRGNFDRVDTNNDGTISREEDAAVFNRGRERGRNRPGQAQQSGQQPSTGNRLPEGIRAQLDIPYADNNNPRQRLDLYLPTKPAGEGPLPIVVWIHGGAWRAGDKKGGLRNVADLVAGGEYAGASIGYRLTGETVWPTQIHDCKAAIRWIRANAEKHNIDPQRIGVWGSSAGGHLVAMLGTSGGVAELEGNLGRHTETAGNVQCVVDYYGPSDIVAMGQYPSNMDHDAPNSPESILVGGPVQETKHVARAASTTTYVTANDPPFLIVHGDNDMTVPYNQSQRLHAALKTAGVDTTFITVTGGGHGRFNSSELLRRVKLFFDEHLRGQDATIPDTAIKVGQDVAAEK